MAPPPLPLPLDPLVATWVELLAQSIKRRHQDGYQGVLAYVVKVAPLLCKEARDLWRAETRAPYLLTFCNYLYGSGYRTRYLDALPLQLMAAPPPVVVDDRPLPAPELFEMHEERRKLAEQLATMVWDDATDESDRQCLYPRARAADGRALLHGAHRGQAPPVHAPRVVRARLLHLPARGLRAAGAAAGARDGPRRVE